MLRRVERAHVTADRALRTKLGAEIEAQVQERTHAEYAERMARLAVRVDQLQRQLDSRSAHDRGVDHERDILTALRSAFPADRIERHGRRGDILHTVMQAEREVGQILYECKNAGTWQNAWLTRLKQDGRKRRTPYLVLVTHRLPAKAAAVCVRDDVAICEPTCAVAVGSIMRQWVIGAHRAESSAQDAPEKARRVYDYLAGAEFRGDFDDMLACTNELDAQDAAERTQHERGWDKRARLYGRLRTAHLRIDTKLEAELDRDVSPAPATVVLDIPATDPAARAA